MWKIESKQAFRLLGALLFVLAAALVFTACLAEIEYFIQGNQPNPGETDGESIFTAAPTLSFPETEGTESDRGKVWYRFSPAVYSGDHSVTYAVYIKEGQDSTAGEITADDSAVKMEGLKPNTTYVFRGTPKTWYSVLAVAERSWTNDRVLSQVGKVQGFVYVEGAGITGDYYTKAPELSFSGKNAGATDADIGKVWYSFTAAGSLDDPADAAYTVYIAKGQYYTVDEVMENGEAIPANPSTSYIHQGEEGIMYSAVVIAEKDSNNRANSAVTQALGFSLFFNEIPPVLTIKNEIANPAPDDNGKLRYNFTAAGTTNPADAVNVAYTVYFFSGDSGNQQQIEQFGERLTGLSPDTEYEYKGQPGNFSAVVIAENKGNANVQITSPVVRKPSFVIEEVEGSGTLISRGKATGAGTTYYIDYGRGNDSNDGKHALTPWKTLTKANNTTFQPGDRILLEAGCIWNGTPTRNGNVSTFLSERGNGGILAPQGNGTLANPIVIDLYELKTTSSSVTVNFSANQRPVINGNGTPFLNASLPNWHYLPSGAVNLVGQDYWHIRNVEVTNSYADFSDPSVRDKHWYDFKIPKMLYGIGVRPGGVNGAWSHNCRGIVVENCYAHDVQSLNNHNENNNWQSTEFGYGYAGDKMCGGIFVDTNHGRVEGNIVKRVGLAGLRNLQGDWGTNNVFRGNYLETIAGDGMVVGWIRGSDSFGVTGGTNLVEGNIIKDACAAPNLGKQSTVATNWCCDAEYVLYQYNESYGTLYGSYDGEAWDVDNNCKYIIYQYNYSHHNSGGTILFMSSNQNAIFRYNVSANDGAGTRYMDKVGPPYVDNNSYTWKAWDGNGQSIIHCNIGGTTPQPFIPLIHNNTFYLGHDLNAALFGNTTDSASNLYVRFYNNIVLKVGAGSIRLCDNHTPERGDMYKLYAVSTPGTFKNNLFYGYETERNTGDKGKFKTVAGQDMDFWIANGNKWADPKLVIQEPGKVAELRTHRDSSMTEAQINDPAALKEYTGLSRLRARASLFAPVDGTSPVIGAGMPIPVGSGSTQTPTIDGAWSGNYGSLSTHQVKWSDTGGITADMFGNTVNTGTPPIGAAAGPFN
jgi:hypothetical protein